MGSSSRRLLNQSTHSRVAYSTASRERQGHADALRRISLARFSYTRSEKLAIALKLTPLIFVRPGELRGAEWDEIDFQRAQWRIPAERMKMKRLHIVPLSRQAVATLRELEKSS